MTTLIHAAPQRLSRHDHSRTWRVAGAVLLAHAGLAWLLSLGLLSSAPPRGGADHVIMARVVVNVPAPPAVIPQPVVPKVQPKPPSRPVAPVTSQAQPQPSPVLTQAAPSQAAPAVPAIANPASGAAGAAAAPAAAGQPRPKPSTAAAALVLPASDADYLHNPAPAYPRMSKRMGEQGTVVLRVFINTEGRAEQAEIHTRSGYSRLDEAALETVKRWRYVPGKRAGVAEAMWFNVPIRFVLD